MELSNDFEIGGRTGDLCRFHQFFPFDGKGFPALIFFSQIEQHREQCYMRYTDP